MKRSYYTIREAVSYFINHLCCCHNIDNALDNASTASFLPSFHLHFFFLPIILISSFLPSSSTFSSSSSSSSSSCSSCCCCCSSSSSIDVKKCCHMLNPSLKG